MRFSRRDVLALAASAGTAKLLGADKPDATPLFEEIPASASGITWVHENAMSPERFLPGNPGPGLRLFRFR